MNNKDLLKLAALNGTLDKEQIRKKAIEKANRIVVIRRAVATAACTVVMVGVLFSVTVLNPPRTQVMIYENFNVNTKPQKKKKKKTAPSSTHKKTYKTVIKTTQTKNKSPLIPWYDNTGETHKTFDAKGTDNIDENTQKTDKSVVNTEENTDKTDETRMRETHAGVLQSTHFLKPPSTVAKSPTDKEVPTVQITKETTYKEYDDYIAVTGYYGDGDTVILPSEINGKPVTTILDSFNSNNNIKYVWIPSSVTHIDEGTFEDSDVVIMAKKGSYAQQYAEKNNLKFSEHTVSY